MKKLINLIALVMLVSTNVLTPLSYGQEEILDNSLSTAVHNSVNEPSGTDDISSIKEKSEENEKDSYPDDENFTESSSKEVNNSENEDVETPAEYKIAVDQAMDEIPQVKKVEEEVVKEVEEEAKQDEKKVLQETETLEKADSDENTDETIKSTGEKNQGLYQPKKADDEIIKVADVDHNKDIVIQVTAEAGQELTIYRYFANNYTIDWGDNSWITSSKESYFNRHTYNSAGTYDIILSLSDGIDRWTFMSEDDYRERYGGLVPDASVTNVIIKSMPSLAEGFGESATNPGDNFFSDFNQGGQITSLPANSFDTSNIETVGNNFFSNFNQGGQITSLPANSFDTSNITAVGNFFFSYFNQNGRLTSLPSGSFDTSNITTVGNYFFNYFNQNGQLTSLPSGSFDTSNIETVGDAFFAGFNSEGSLASLPEGSFDTSNIENINKACERCGRGGHFNDFNYHGKIQYLPDSFSINSGLVEVGGYYRAFYSPDYSLLNKKVSDLVAGLTPPSDDRDTFSDNQPGREGVFYTWLGTYEYTVLYDGRGGGTPMPAVSDGGNIIYLPNTQKVGYTFLGRYTQAEGGEKVGGYNDSYLVTEDITLYAHWSPLGEGESNTITIDSIDGGKITIMEEDIGIIENNGWTQRNQGPCQAGYHVPTMQDWNTLFVSWCENHTKLNDGICDVRDLDRDVWEENMKDFIYKPKDKKVLDAFAAELNLKRGFESDCDEEDGYCYDYDPEDRSYGYSDPDDGFIMDNAYRTSNPYRETDQYPMSWIYMLSSDYSAINWTKLNSWKLNVRCFSDEYSAPDRVVLVDIIDKDKLEEYKQIEENFRSGDESLPDDKLMEIAITEMFLGNQSRESLKEQLRFILIPRIEEKYNCEDCSEMSDEEKQYYINLKDLVEAVVSADEFDDISGLIDRVNNFEWMEPDDSIDCSRFGRYYDDWGRWTVDKEVELYCENYEVDKYTKSYLLYILGEIDSIPGLSEADLSQEIENVKQMFYRWIDSDYDFFTEEERQNLKKHIDELEKYDVNSAIDMLKSVSQEIHDLMQKYPEESYSEDDGTGFGFYPWEMASWFLDIIKIAAEFTDANKLIGEDFTKESKIYLGTDNWIRGDGTIDVKEMVLQEYLQDIFSQMGYRVVVSPNMTAKQIREKIANIKGVSLEDDEYLALFDVEGNEININAGMKQNNRGYIGVKKIPIEPEKEPEENGGKGSGYSGGGGGGGGGGGNSNPNTPKPEQKPEETPQDDNQQKPDLESPRDNTQNSSNETPDSHSNDNSYTSEQKEAYEFAHDNGITTMPTIQKANIDGKLTRIQMAKMLSQYAINVLGKTPDTSKMVKFKDVSSKMNADYDNGVILAYQLGIMGQNMKDNKFRPDDEVSRAEFATALSRLLYSTSDGEYKNTSKYYVNHMEKLVSEGIITKDDPEMKERRGYVMIMLMRSAK